MLIKLRPKKNNFMNFKTQILLFIGVFMMKSDVHLQRISRPEGFFAEAAGKSDSLDVICFNVIFYSISFAFLSTDLTPISFDILVWVIVITLFHHWHHHFLKLVVISRKIIWDRKCSVVFISDDFAAESYETM